MSHEYFFAHVSRPHGLCDVFDRLKRQVFDLQHPPNVNQPRNADSFSVECRSERGGVIDRESVDEMPGSAPAVHHITSFALNERQVQDRFGQLGLELYVIDASWGRIGNSVVGLFVSGHFVSHHEDNTWWTCAN
jgi:hypothetical protein